MFAMKKVSLLVQRVWLPFHWSLIAQDASAALPIFAQVTILVQAAWLGITFFVSTARYVSTSNPRYLLAPSLPVPLDASCLS
jgi:hypothetical protein